MQSEGTASAQLDKLHAISPDTDASGLPCPKKVEMIRKLLGMAPEALVNCTLWSRAADVVAEGAQKPTEMQALCATCGEEFAKHAGFVCRPPAVQPLREWGDTERPPCEGHVWLNHRSGESAVGGLSTKWFAGKVLQHLGESLFAVQYSGDEEDAQIVNLTPWALGVQVEAYMGHDIFTPLHVLNHADVANAVQTALGISLSHTLSSRWPEDKFQATSLLQVFRQLQHLHIMPAADLAGLRSSIAPRLLPLHASLGDNAQQLLSFEVLSPLLDIEMDPSLFSSPAVAAMSQCASDKARRAAPPPADEQAAASAQSATMVQYVASVAAVLKQALSVHQHSGSGSWIGSSASAELQRRIAVPILQSLAAYLQDDAVRQLLMMQAANARHKDDASNLAQVCESLLQHALAALAAFQAAATPQGTSHTDAADSGGVPPPPLPGFTALRLERSLSTSSPESVQVQNGSSSRTRERRASIRTRAKARLQRGGGGSLSHYLDHLTPTAGESSTPAGLATAVSEGVVSAVASLGIKVADSTRTLLQEALAGVEHTVTEPAHKAVLLGRICSEAVLAGLHQLQHSLQPRCETPSAPVAPLLEGVQVLASFEQASKLLLLGPHSGLNAKEPSSTFGNTLQTALQAALRVYGAREALQNAAWQCAGAQAADAATASVSASQDPSAIHQALCEYRASQALLLLHVTQVSHGNVHRALQVLASNRQGLRDVLAAQRMTGADTADAADTSDHVALSEKRSTADELLYIARLPPLTPEHWPQIVRVPGIASCLAGPVASAAVSIMETAGAGELLTTPDFEVGDEVRVKLSVAQPKHNWGSVRPGDVGVVATTLSGGKLKVDFPSCKGWTAAADEMELACAPRLALSSEVIESLLRLADEEKLCLVEAIKCWAESALTQLVATIPDIRVQLAGPLAATASETLSADRELTAGSYVRVKPSVSEPGLGWGDKMSRPTIVKVVTYSSEAMVAICEIPDSSEQWECFGAELEVVPQPSELWAVAKAFAAFHGEETPSQADGCESPTEDEHVLKLLAKQRWWFDAAEQDAQLDSTPSAGARGDVPSPGALQPASGAAFELPQGMTLGDDADYANFATSDPLSPERIQEIKKSISIGVLQADSGVDLLLPAYVLNMLPPPKKESLLQILHLPLVEKMLHGPAAKAALRALVASKRPLRSGESVHYLAGTEQVETGALIEASDASITILGENGNVLNVHPLQVIREIPQDDATAILKAYGAWRAHSRAASRRLHALSTDMPVSEDHDYLMPSSEPRSLWEVLGIAEQSNVAAQQHESTAQAAVAVMDVVLASLLDLSEHAEWLANALRDHRDVSSDAGSAVAKLLAQLQSNGAGLGESSETVHNIVSAAASAVLPRQSVACDEPLGAEACRVALPVLHSAVAVRLMQIMRARVNTKSAMYGAASVPQLVVRNTTHISGLLSSCSDAFVGLMRRATGRLVGSATSAADDFMDPLQLHPAVNMAHSSLHAAGCLRALLLGMQVGSCGQRRVLVGPSTKETMAWSKPAAGHSQVRDGKSRNSVVLLRQQSDGTSSDDVKTAAVRAVSGWRSGVHEWTTVVTNTEFGTSTEIGICDEHCRQTSSTFEQLLGSASAGGAAWMLGGGDRNGLFHDGNALLPTSSIVPGFQQPTCGSASDTLLGGLRGGSLYLWKLDCDNKSVELRVCTDKFGSTFGLVAKWSIADVWDGQSRLFPCVSSTRQNVQVEISAKESQSVMLWQDYQRALTRAQEAAVESERQLLKDIGHGTPLVDVTSDYSAANKDEVQHEAPDFIAHKGAPSVTPVGDTLSRVQSSSIRSLKDIGMGGFGVVRLVECDDFPGMQFACKQLQSGISFEQTAELQAINAIQSRSKHPNIVWVQALVQDGDKCTGLLMSYAAGGCLTKAIFPGGQAAPVELAGQPGPFQQIPSLRKRMQWCVQISSALAHLHELHVWHRDFKPDNVLLTSSNWQEADAKLADFGQSKLTQGGATQNTRTTTTLLYFPPEAMQNKWNAGSDVYQLGLTLYQILTGNNLWTKLNSSSNLQAVLMHLLCVDTTRVIADCVGDWPEVVPDAATHLLKLCLSRNYADRPTARQVAVGLNSALSLLSIEST